MGITVSEFFYNETKNPTKLNTVIADLKKLDDQQLDTIANLIKGLIKKYCISKAARVGGLNLSCNSLCIIRTIKH